MNLLGCKSLTLLPIDATWYRAIPMEHYKNALGTGHTANLSTRFSPGRTAKVPSEILYLAENQMVALYEVGALFGPPDQPIAHPAKSKTVTIDVRVRLQSVADLTDPTQRALLDVSTQELTGNWDDYPAGEAPTQRLGATLCATRNVEGFLAISAKVPLCKTLIIFPRKLRKGSHLEFNDLITGRLHRIPT
jgi:RES domain-containing protein